MMKIDAVITWVDGNDPEHRRRRAEYGSDRLFKIKDVASINRFAPWIRRIYIVTEKGSHMNGARLAGSRFWFLRLAHCQKAVRRDFYQIYFSEHLEELVRNISYRFRSAEQFTPQALQYMTLYDRGECELRSPRFIPMSRHGYFEDKMKKLEYFSGKFACFNNVDLATPEQLKMLISWIERRLDLSF